MTIEPHSVRVSRPSLWSRARVQLVIGLFVAVLLPWWVRTQFTTSFGEAAVLPESALGTAAAVVIGYYGFRRLSAFPGVRASYPILPAFMISYGAVLAVFFFTRLDYSRLHFLTSFVLCVVCYYTVYFFVDRRRRLRIGVVPAGEIDKLFGIPRVEWAKLSSAALNEADWNRPRFDVIVADLRADIPDQWERYLADCVLNGVLVMHVKQLEESLTGRVAIEHLSENNLGSLLPGIVYGKVKRAVDLAVALVVLPLIAPFLLVTAIAIRLETPGPIIFRQERMGYRGRTFTMYKFRTMTHQAAQADDARSAAMTKDGDGRITKVGRLLRRWRIDEVPQILNILKGEMSWIGPRPEAVPLSQWYEQALPFYRYRHIVRPGITGWAQVRQGHVAEVNDVLWKLHYDFYYIKHFSFWLDMLIVAGTVRTLLSGFGAR